MRHSSNHSICRLANVNSVAGRRTFNYHSLLWIVCIFYCIDYSLVETSKPLNHVAVKGEAVQLNCSTTEEYNGYWKYTKPFSDKEMRLYDGDKIVSGLELQYSAVDAVRGHFNLLFNSSESTSGRYICEPDIFSSHHSAELVVLDAPPICSQEVIHGIVGLNVSCSLNFSGNWAPIMEWYNMKGKLETNDTITIANHRVTSTLIVPINPIDIGALYILTCTSKFKKEDKPQKTTAQNVPEVSYNCTLTIEASTEAPSTQPSSTPPPPPQPLPIVIIVIIVIVIACVGATLVVILILLRRGRSLTGSPRAPNTLEPALYSRGNCTRDPQHRDHSEVVLMPKAVQM